MRRLGVTGPAPVGVALAGVALVGVGSIADFHLHGLRAAGGAEVRAVAARSAASAAAYATRHGVPVAVADWRHLLTRPDIDALVVATPDRTHREIAEAAASAGKGVLVQKPMASTTADAAAMVDCAARHGTVLEVSFMHRFLEEVVAAQALLAAGAIGRVVSLHMRNATPGPDWAPWFHEAAEVGGGVVAQIGVHGIDVLQMLAGPIETVSATTAILRAERRLADGRVVAGETPDIGHAVYRFAGGTAATHTMSFHDTGGTDRFFLRVDGQAGSLELRGPRGLLAVQDGSGWRTIDVADVPPGARLHAQFLAVLRGGQGGGATAAAGLSSLRVVEAVLRAGNTGCRVRVGDAG